ncbi:MAG: histidine--tRNA ligase [Candidatus Aenigmarchaeota archaeon]|nr:histidine--tRNA ligase [Candidatus Aenigmarchaeota archaeon]
MAIQPPKGTRDFLPQEMAVRQYVFDIVREVFERFGFEPLETPAIESWELLSRKGGGGEDIKKEVYYFRDKGDREIGLRFDLTAPLGRVVASNPQIPKPFKRYQIAPVWRYDNPQAGRYREFWQADADIVGSEKMDCEAECLVASAAILEALGFRDFAIKLNNRKILNGIIEFLQIPKEKAPDVFRALDKLEKFGEIEVLKEILKAGVKQAKARKLLEMIKARGSPSTILERERKRLQSYSIAKQGMDELEQIVRKCEAYGIARKLIIDLSLVRGLDYYTGPIFEISVRTKKDIGSIAGGGRYDNLVEAYGGRWTPAVGISLGIERICEIMDSEKMVKHLETKTRVFVAVADEGLTENAMFVAQKLRAAGINTQIELMGRPLKKQLEYVDRAKIPFVVIVGEKELKKGKYTVREMAKRKQGQFSLDKIIKVLGEKK